MKTVPVRQTEPEINYALVEDTRPPIYKAMKYWGKKPHNIWSRYIDRYCPPDGIVLDPFLGSGIAAFEAARLQRRCIGFDLNPLSAFFIEVLASPFDELAFRSAYERVIADLLNDPVYLKHYTRPYHGKTATVFNYRWYAGQLATLAIKTEDGEQAHIKAEPCDVDKVADLEKIRIPYWYPDDKFPNSPSITHKFVKDLGGDRFKDLWTKRNLYLLAKLFHNICAERDRNVKLQLLSGFIQTLHLTCKMVYPRSTESKRDFSGSWGRADYMIRRKSMEQNPLVIFSRSCMEKQGVVAAMRDAAAAFPQGVRIAEITKSRKLQRRALINYGIVDVADLARYLGPKSVDFILTDPPYAGLVRYLDLSLVWLVWLKHLDRKFSPDLLAEITIKKGHISREEYRRRLRNAFQQMHRVLKDEGKLVVTFHHQKISEWNEFINAVRMSGFKFDKVTHQYNRRSGESNVANPYGTSGSDFYIRCVKERDVDFTNDASGLEHFIVQKTVEIIARRNEQTPYNFIFDGLVPELLQAGWSDLSASRDDVKKILAANAGPGKVFTCTENKTSKAGDIWWFNEPAMYINHPDRPLKDRVEDTVLAFLRRKVSVRLDDVLAVLFREYPNGLTPDIRAVRSILEKYAFRSAGNWKLKESVAQASTQHTEILRRLCAMGKRAGLRTFVGRREQAESCADGSVLREAATLSSLRGFPGYNTEQLERIEMIDSIWVEEKDNAIVCAFEVEHSTNFTSAIQRASNLSPAIPKFMVIPDGREAELLSVHDPLFTTTFEAQHWGYMNYTTVEKLTGFSQPTIEEIARVAKTL
jgi:SAM-dependent methyltransferase